MDFDLEEDFENERWSLLALVDARKSLSDGSESAITTDLMILAARELIRKYETLKGYWSRKAFQRGTPGLVIPTRHASGGPGARSGSTRTSPEKS
jgi:hypothetical protein